VVGVRVDPADLAAPLGELFARVGLALGAGRALVDDVVDHAAELVHVRERVALARAEKEKGELEVRGRALGRPPQELRGTPG
jgi:hypothetical protein